MASDANLSLVLMLDASCCHFEIFFEFGFAFGHRS